MAHLNIVIRNGSECNLNIVPDTVEYFAVGEDSDVNVGHDNVVKMSFTLVGKEQIWHPYLGRVC